MDDDEEIQLEEGMPVANEAGEKLGKLAALLVPEDDDEDEEDEAEFLILETDGVERLVPFEAVLGVGDGSLILDVPRASVPKFPKVRADQEPSDEDVAKAYEVYDEGAEYEADE